MCRLNPRVDFAFKKLFGSEENKSILISFINAVVSEDDQVKDVRLIQSDNLSILDIKATDQQGRQYNIEMQVTDQMHYDQRALYYWSKLYCSQLKEGVEFGDLKKTISINVLNFDCLDQEPHYHNVFNLLNAKTHRCYFEDLEIHFIELNKFIQENHPIKTALDRWVNFLNQAHLFDKEHIPEALQGDENIEKAIYVLDTLSLSDAEREVYEARLKWLRDEEATLLKTKFKAHKEGWHDGRGVGYVEGKQEGIAEGKQEGLVEVAKKLLKANEDIQEISALTELSVHDIKQLAETIVDTEKV